MRWQVKRLAHLRIGCIDHGRFDGTHWRGAMAHVKDGRCATPNDGSTGVGKLVDGNTAQTFSACWTTEPSKVTGAAAPAKGIEISSAGTRARASSIRLPAPKSLQISGGDGHTSKTACGFSASAWRLTGKDRQHIDHCAEGLKGKGTGHDRFLRKQQHDVQPVQVADCFGDFIADDRRGLGIILREHFGHLDQAHQVLANKRFVLQCFRIEDMDPG